MNGIVSISRSVYDAAQGINWSLLHHLSHPYTPAHFKQKIDEPPQKSTDAQRYGLIFHRCIFEPDTVKSAFVVKPEDMSFATKEGKAWREENKNQEILTQSEATTIQCCVDAVWRHPIAKRLLVNADFERSLFAEDEHGTIRKARLDVFPHSGNVLPDLKSCASAHPDEFEKSIINYEYMAQAAFYIDLCALLGIYRPNFCFICVEKTPPYLVAVYQLEQEVIEWGRRIYQRNLTIYRRCMETGQWSGYDENVTLIGVPQWARKAMENSI